MPLPLPSRKKGSGASACNIFFNTWWKVADFRVMWSGSDICCFRTREKNCEESLHRGKSLWQMENQLRRAASMAKRYWPKDSPLEAERPRFISVFSPVQKQQCPTRFTHLKTRGFHDDKERIDRRSVFFQEPPLEFHHFALEVRLKKKMFRVLTKAFGFFALLKS